MTPYLGQLALYSFGFPPKGWAQCNGQLLPINQNQALFSLLGTQYGGDGRVNFALPNLQGRMAICFSSGFTQGARGGEAAHILLVDELAAHTHPPSGSTLPANATTPVGNYPAVANTNPYSTLAADTVLGSASSKTGGALAHENMSPYAVLNYCIALQGIFPSQN
jgi:microcystin-dependent protein